MAATLIYCIKVHMVRKKKKKHDLDSVEGIVEQLTVLYEDPASKPMERIRCLKELAELRGLVVFQGQKDLRKRSPEDLEELLDTFVLPVMRRFGFSTHVKRSPENAEVGQVVEAES